MTRQQRTALTQYRKVAAKYWDKPTSAHANELDEAENNLIREFLGYTERVHNQRYHAVRAALITAGEVVP